MNERHKRRPDGLISDGVRVDPLSHADLASYHDIRDRMKAFEVPVIYNADRPHHRLFVANFDGTGNDAVNDPEHITNIGLLSESLATSAQNDPHVRSKYLEGPGTQKSFLPRTYDGMTGHTYDDRLEKMYLAFIDQAARWLDEDPDADIRLLTTGFSRGADQAAGFTRMVHERGVQDPAGRRVEHHLFGHDTVSFSLPPRRPPGSIPQAAGLADPVGTSHPEEHNRRLAASVVAGFQIVARDEKRNLFPSTQIIRQGLSEDGRFLGITVPGAHSDVGGSYHLDGLGILNGNLMADFVNGLSSTPLMEKRGEPSDRARYVIHHSEDHMPFYRRTDFDRYGYRESHGAQIDPPSCRIIERCDPPEPMDARMEGILASRHPIDIGALPPSVEPTADRTLSPHDGTAGIYPASLPPELVEKDNSINFRAFDVDRHKEVGNIPVPPDFFHRPDTTPESSLITVHREPNPHPSRAAELRRDVELANAQTAQELALPHTHAQDPTLAHAQGKVASVDQERAESQDRTEPRNPIDQQAPSQRPSQPEGMPRRTATAEHESAINHQATPSEPRHSPVPSPRTPDPRHPDHPDHKMHTTVGFLLARNTSARASTSRPSSSSASPRTCWSRQSEPA